MEYLPLSLTQCLETYQDLPLQIKYSILLDVAKGLNYLHCKRPPIVHRDLTANNILLTSNFIAKISDLGVSRMADTFKRQHLTKAPGNVVVMPPEALKDNPIYDHKLDIFSYGCLILHVFTHQWPEPTEQYVPSTSWFRWNSFDLVSEWDRRSKYTKQLQNDPLYPFTKQCLDNNPNNRPTMNNAIQCIEGIKLTPLKNKLETLKEISDLKELLQSELRLSKENELAHLRDEVQKLEQTLKEAHENLKQIFENAEVIKKDSIEELRKKELENKSLQRQLTETKTSKVNELAHLQDVVQKSEEAKKQVHDDLRILTAEKTKLLTTLSTKQKEITEQTKLIQVQANQSRQYLKQVSEAREKAKLRENELQKQLHDLEKKESENVDLKRQLTKSNTSLKKANSTVKSLTDENVQLRSDISMLNETLQNTLKSKEETIHILQSDWSVLPPSHKVQKETIQPLLAQPLIKEDSR